MEKEMSNKKRGQVPTEWKGEGSPIKYQVFVIVPYDNLRALRNWIVGKRAEK